MTDTEFKNKLLTAGFLPDSRSELRKLKKIRFFGQIIHRSGQSFYINKDGVYKVTIAK